MKGLGLIIHKGARWAFTLSQVYFYHYFSVNMISGATHLVAQAVSWPVVDNVYPLLTAILSFNF